MLKGSLLQVTNQYRALLRAREKHDEREIERYYAYVLMMLLPALDSLYRQMSEAAADGKTIPVTWLYEANRLASIKRIIQSQIDQFATISQMQVQQAQQYAVQLGQEAALEMLNASMPVGARHTLNKAHPTAVANLVGMTPNGIPLAYLFVVFGREAADLAGKALITGISLGDNPRKVARTVQKALGVSRNRALVIARQEMFQAYRAAHMATLRANDDIIDGWIWSALLDRRTCAACIAMDGTEHNLSETMDSHVCCRCMQLPKIKSPGATMSVPDGPTWFAQQDDATQLAILGSKAAFNLYKSGDASLRDFVGTHHDPVWGRSRYQKSAKQVAAKVSKH